MPEARQLRVLPFDRNNLPDCFRLVRQGKYLWQYLHALQAATVIEEPGYFDRDWLADLASHYSSSAAGYSNRCLRLHFFSVDISPQQFEEALGDGDAAQRLQGSYLGFCVIRPLPDRPFGRTVLAWYPEPDKTRPRVIGPARNYTAHLAGLELKVHGLAWQQQDTNVSVCATVAVWSMCHSSAFDERHAVPTAAQVAFASRRGVQLSQQLYPAKGMSMAQAIDAIEGLGLRPVTIGGDLRLDLSHGRIPGFSPIHFATRVSAFIRSGYVVMLLGALLTKKGHDMHALCAVGYRSSTTPEPGTFDAVVRELDVIYLHDDNIGPAARFAVETFDDDDPDEPLQVDPAVVLRCVPPAGTPAAAASIVDKHPRFVPTSMLVAVHPELRLSDGDLTKVGMELARKLAGLLERAGKPELHVLAGVRFIRQWEYFTGHLESLVATPALLAKVRKELFEQTVPMGYFLGVVRLALRTPTGLTPVMEILFDASDSSHHPRAFGHLILVRGFEPYAARMARATSGGLGPLIEAFSTDPGGPADDAPTTRGQT